MNFEIVFLQIVNAYWKAWLINHGDKPEAFKQILERKTPGIAFGYRHEYSEFYIIENGYNS